MYVVHMLSVTLSAADDVIHHVVRGGTPLHKAYWLPCFISCRALVEQANLDASDRHRCSGYNEIQRCWIHASHGYRLHGETQRE